MSTDPARDVLVRECSELMAEIDGWIQWQSEEALPVEQARSHRHWSVLVARGDIAVEAALRRAFPVLADPQVRDLWLAFAAEAAMADFTLLAKPLDERLLAWRGWALVNGIDLPWGVE